MDITLQVAKCRQDAPFQTGASRKIKRNQLFIQGGPGSGFHGHRGRIGEVGGSVREATSSIQSESYKDAKGNTIYRIKAGSELPEEFIEDLQKNDQSGEGLVRFIYNSSSKNWHISTHGTGDSDHGDFVTDALDGHTPEYTEQIQVRGIYDFVEHKLAIYEFSQMSDDIAEENDLSPKQVARDIDKATKSAEKHMFYYMGEKPEIEFMSMEDLFGNSNKVLRNGKKLVIKQVLFFMGGPGSGHHGHAGRPGQVGGSQDDDGGKEINKMRIVHHGTSLEAVKKIEKEGLKRKAASIGDRPASVYFMNSFQQTKEYVQDLHLENDQGYAIVSFSVPDNVTVLEDEEEGDSYRIEADIPANLIQSITYYDSSNRRIHTQGSRRTGYSIVVFPLGKGK